MRFGCCLNMVASGKDGTGIELIKSLSAAGFDYAELPLAEMVHLSEREFTYLLNKVEDSGIRCEVCNNFFPASVRLTGDSVDTEAVKGYTLRALERAERLGVQHIVFGSGGAKNIPKGFSREKGYDQIVELLKNIAPHAKDRGIGIVIEPLRKAECNIINTFKEGCDLSGDVGKENVKVLVDFYHLREENEPVDILVEKGNEYLRHVHFCCSVKRIFPKKIDEDIYPPFIEALKTIGYQGRLSIEAYSEDFRDDVTKSRDFLRKYLSY